MDFCKKIITFRWRTPDRESHAMEVEYTVFHDTQEIIDIRNEFHYSVEKNSMVWGIIERRMQKKIK